MMLEFTRYVSRFFLHTDKLIPAVIVVVLVSVIFNVTPGSGLYME
jgi:hypothetical protein